MTRGKLVFATRNQGKLVELRQLLEGLELEVVSIDEWDSEVPDTIEDGETFEDNATKKALEVSRATGMPALADDSGLEVDALGSRPGVFSARYAGERATDEDNNKKLLLELETVAPAERGARFCSVLAFADTAGRLGDRVLTAAGQCAGQILEKPRGDGGFGYDPLFLVSDLGLTFAELGVGTKNDRSHRARAMRAMKPLLLDYYALARDGG